MDLIEAAEESVLERGTRAQLFQQPVCERQQTMGRQLQLRPQLQQRVWLVTILNRPIDRCRDALCEE